MRAPLMSLLRALRKGCTAAFWCVFGGDLQDQHWTWFVGRDLPEPTHATAAIKSAGSHPRRSPDVVPSDLRASR